MIGATNPTLSDPELNTLMQELNDIGGALPDKSLTSREREIADRLNISVRTVETHKNNIFRKLGINTTAELMELLRGGAENT